MKFKASFYRATIMRRSIRIDVNIVMILFGRCSESVFTAVVILLQSTAEFRTTNASGYIGNEIYLFSRGIR